jgi:mono/diheme cytochrome c family protein
MGIYGDGKTRVRRSRITMLVALAVLTATAGAGCRQDMHDQPRYQPYRRSEFFLDQRQVRPLPEGTVARGHLDADDHLYRGLVDGAPATTFPMPVTSEVLARGRERFNIYCSPCHDRTGSGEGMIVQRGYPQPTSFHEDRLRQAPPGYFYNAILNGFGVMPSYAMQVPVDDRWAIIAYIRALQFSQNAGVADVPAAQRAALDGHAADAHGAGAKTGGSTH